MGGNTSGDAWGLSNGAGRVRLGLGCARCGSWCSLRTSHVREVRIRSCRQMEKYEGALTRSSEGDGNAKVR